MIDQITLNEEYDDEVYTDFTFFRSRRESRGWDENARKSMNFYFGDQWDTQTKQILKDLNRAPSVFNMVLPAVDLIVGHHLENKIDVIAKPVDRIADSTIASFFTVGIKHIEQSNAVDMEDRAQFVDGIITGVGIKETWYDTERDIEGKIITKQSPSWEYFLDPNFHRYDYTDAKKLFRVKWLDKKQIARIYGEKVAKKLEIPSPEAIHELPTNYVEHTYGEVSDYGNRGGSERENTFDNFSYDMGYDAKNKLFRLVEQYEQVWEEKEIYYDPEEEEWLSVEILSDDEKELIKNQIIKKQEPHIHLTTLIGMERIQDDPLRAQEFYQIFNFFFPYFVNGRYMGIIENLFYPQEEVNKRHSTIISILTSLANSGIYYTAEAFSNEDEADIAHKLATSGAIKVNAIYDSENRRTIEERTPPKVDAIYERIINDEKDNIKYIAGASDPMQGLSQRRESGTAKRTDIERGTRRLAGMVENFRISQYLQGKAYIWWMQNYYTEDKFLRISGTGYGETDQDIELNKRAFGTIFNDITVGDYDIVLSYEGKTQTERERIQWKVLEMGRNDPQNAYIYNKIILDHSDLPQKDKIIQEIEQNMQMVAQERQAAVSQKTQNRGGIQSAPRPGRGERRAPASTG